MKSTQEEIAKCTESLSHFARNYCGLDGSPFIPNLHQCAVFYAFSKHKKLAVKHPRQIGMSTSIAIYSLWKLLFFSNAIFNVSHLHKTHKFYFELLLRMIRKLPKFMRDLLEVNRSTIRNTITNSIFNCITPYELNGAPYFSIVILDNFPSSCMMPSGVFQRPNVIATFSGDFGLNLSLHQFWNDANCGLENFCAMTLEDGLSVG